MNLPPTDPNALRARGIAALCDDILGNGPRFGRTDALRQIIADPTIPKEGRAAQQAPGSNSR